MEDKKNALSHTRPAIVRIIWRHLLIQRTHSASMVMAIDVILVSAFLDKIGRYYLYA